MQREEICPPDVELFKGPQDGIYYWKEREDGSFYQIYCTQEVQTYFGIIPADIRRYEFSFTDPMDVQMRCRDELYKPLCQNDKVLEEYLINRGLELYIENVNAGLKWAALIGSPDFVDYFIKKGATNFNWGMIRAAQGGHLDLVEFFILRGAWFFDIAMVEAAKRGHLHVVKFLTEHH